MKILFDHHQPFALAQGGIQVQVEQTMTALGRLGLTTEHLRWWDSRQRGDLIHFFGPANSWYLDQARIARMPVIITPLFTETCNRAPGRLKRQGWMVNALLSLPFGEGVKQQLAWRAYQNCAHHVVGLEAERGVLEYVYRVPSEKVSVVPLGLSEAYLASGAGLRGANHLITTGTITERKNSLALAQLAQAARAPVLFVGKPYHPDDAYWLRFKRLIDNQWVKYQAHVESEAEMIALLRPARGFVFMSRHENWCLSAHEAAACGLPLLVQSQNWSRERFGAEAAYFPEMGVTDRNVEALQQFNAAAPRLGAPNVKLYSWDDVARQLQAVYERVLNAAKGSA